MFAKDRSKVALKNSPEHSNLPCPSRVTQTNKHGVVLDVSSELIFSL